MALTKPILNEIPAFDASQAHNFTFISIGGDQVTGNQLTIYENETGTQVYQANYTSFKFEHPLNAGVLTNGKYYNATIATINSSGQFSEPSNPVAFYCYTSPSLTITNIPAGGTIEQSNYMFQGSYSQLEGELLNGYQFILYDSNKEKISSSDILYDSLYSYTFSGLSNDTSYYIELVGNTVNNTSVSSGLILFTVRYIRPASFAICDLVNNCQEGYIQISSNIISIDGKSEPDPPKYIDDKEVDLRDKGNWVEWNEGFNIKDDFTMRIWGRGFNDYEKLVTMSNELNTEKSPNKIEIEWYVTEIIDSLPQYVFAQGNIAVTNDAKNESLKQLSIGGYCTQIVNDYSEKTAIGENIHIRDGNISKSNYLQPRGNLKQTTYKGTNKLGDYEVRNNLGAYSTVLFAKSGELKTNTTYTISFTSIESGNQYYTNEEIFTTQPRFVTVVGLNSITVTTKNSISKDSSGEWQLIKNAKGQRNAISMITPMIQEGEVVTDYEPFCGGVPSPNNLYPQTLTVETGTNRIVARNKNFLFDFHSEPLTNNGITFTQNEKGGITANGALSGGTDAIYYLTSTWTAFPDGEYILTGCPANGGRATYRIDVYKEGWQVVGFDNGQGLKFTLSNDKIRIRIIVFSSSVENVEFYPMLRRKDDLDAEFIKGKETIFPLQLGNMELPGILEIGDYLTVNNDKAVRAQNLTKIVLTGSETFTMDEYQGYKRFIYKPTGIKNESARGIIISDYFNSYQLQSNYLGLAYTLNGSVYMYADTSITTVAQFTTWLSSHNVTLYIPINETLIEITDTTLSNQIKAIYNFKIYEGINNIYSQSDNVLPLIKLGYNIDRETPTIENPSPIHETGDIGNNIDVADTTISYTDDTFLATQPENNYILLPNRIYTVNFDYIIRNATTDVYFGVSYGTKTEPVGDILVNGTSNIQYSTQTSGHNTLTFQTPSTFSGVDTPYLWIKFAKTIISATVDVEISNASLFFGNYSSYQEYRKYNIPFKILTENLFDYTKLLYLIDNNTTHSLISNGYSVNIVDNNEDGYILIGYTNNLNEGKSYTLTYQTLGDFLEFNLYTVKKGTTTIENEILLNNGTFIAPSSGYDFMLKFKINRQGTSGNMNIWNISLINGSSIKEYTQYTENGLNMMFNSPLNGVGTNRDVILMENINLLNPSTLRATVSDKKSYYFSSNTNNSYDLDFYNEENKKITTKTVTTGQLEIPEDCRYISSGNFTYQKILSEEIQIEEGTSFSQYVPFIFFPSLIRKINKKVFDGKENWRAPSSNDKFIVFANNTNDNFYNYHSENDIQSCNYLRFKR